MRLFPGKKNALGQRQVGLHSFDLTSPPLARHATFCHRGAMYILYAALRSMCGRCLPKSFSFFIRVESHVLPHIDPVPVAELKFS
jgi:hypothetical protein